MITKIDELITHAQALKSDISVAVIHPNDEVVLASALQAKEMGIITPILIGVTHKIEAAAAKANLSLEGIEIIQVAHSHAASEKAAELVRSGSAHMIVKGSVHTDEMMGILVSGKQGIRTDRRMSHVFVMQVDSYHKLLLISDAGLNVQPELKVKRDIVQNSIDVAHVLNNPMPRVAILSAQENVKPQVPSTLDAAALCKMVDRRQITGGLLDGPLAFDNAISREAADMKGIKSEVSGNVDILITPDLEAGNMLSKQLTYLANAESAGVVMGAKVPIVLTSRSASEKSRIYSFSLGALVAHAKLENKISKKNHGIYE